MTSQADIILTTTCQYLNRRVEYGWWWEVQLDTISNEIHCAQVQHRLTSLNCTPTQTHRCSRGCFDYNPEGRSDHNHNIGQVKESCGHAWLQWTSGMACTSQYSNCETHHHYMWSLRLLVFANIIIIIIHVKCLLLLFASLLDCNEHYSNNSTHAHFINEYCTSALRQYTLHVTITICSRGLLG